MSIPAVTLVTARADSADNLSDQDYNDIYAELRAKCPLRQFSETIRSAVSFAWWNKYEHGEGRLNRDRRNELRAAVGLPRLPETVAAVTATIDPDAAIYQVGAGAPDRVVMIGNHVSEPLVLRLNGNLHVLPDTPVEPLAEEARVTLVTRATRPRSYKSVAVTVSTYESLLQAKKGSGLTWDIYMRRAQIADELIAALEDVEQWVERNRPTLAESELWAEHECLRSTVCAALERARGARQ